MTPACRSLVRSFLPRRPSTTPSSFAVIAIPRAPARLGIEEQAAGFEDAAKAGDSNDKVHVT